MKKLLFVAMCLMAVVACKQEVQQPVVPDGGQNDSLQRIIEQKDNEINDLVGTLYEIQEGFREINEAENRVSVAKSGERADKAQQIRENMQFIADRMAKNRELIQKLQKQLSEGTVKSDQLQKTIEGLMEQLESKNLELQQLRADLDAKDIHISELDENIANLNTNVKNLQNERESRRRRSSTRSGQAAEHRLVCVRNEEGTQGPGHPD